MSNSKQLISQMHPHFNAMRGNGGVAMPHRLPTPMTPPHYPPNMQNAPQLTVNQFNQRLVQEIQQNHPMLPFNRLNNNFSHHPQLNQIQMQHHNNNNNNLNQGMNGKNPQMMQHLKVNGNLVRICSLGWDVLPDLNDFFYVLCRTKNTTNMLI